MIKLSKLKSTGTRLLGFLIALIAVVFLVVSEIVRKAKSRQKQGSISKWQIIKPTQKIRNDLAGQGHFKAPRVGYRHQGLDLEVQVGQTLYAPFEGTITRIAYPYPKDLRWKGFVLVNADTEMKVFYAEVSKSLIGKKVKQGEAIGKAQAISDRYTPLMQNHIHIEVRIGGTLQDPASFLKIG